MFTSGLGSQNPYFGQMTGGLSPYAGYPFGQQQYGQSFQQTPQLLHSVPQQLQQLLQIVPQQLQQVHHLQQQQLHHLQQLLQIVPQQLQYLHHLLQTVSQQLQQVQQPFQSAQPFGGQTQGIGPGVSQQSGTPWGWSAGGQGIQSVTQPQSAGMGPQGFGFGAPSGQVM